MKNMNIRNLKKISRLPNPIPPAGQRPDKRGKKGIAHPDSQSLREEYEWRRTHIQ